MSVSSLYILGGAALFVLSVFGFLTRRHLIRRVIAFNIMGGGVFMVFCGAAARGEGPTDPVPQALIITGIVVAVAATALALGLVLRLYRETGQVTLDLPPEGPGG